MKLKKRNQSGFLFISIVLIILILGALAYLFLLSKESTSPKSSIQLDLSKNEITKSSDIIYLKAHVKNGSTYEIRHTIINTGKRDITRITLVGSLLQKKNQQEAKFIFIEGVKFGDQLYMPIFLKQLHFDLNGDGKISLYEFSLNHFPLGSLFKGQEREFILQGKYEKGLPPFNSDNKETRILVDFTYKLE